MLICLTLLILAGCSPEQEPALPPEALFCDVEEARRFTQKALDWRSANDATNLRRDFQTNKTGTRECGWFGGEK